MAEQPADQPARAVAPMTSVPAVLSMLLGLLARGVRCALRLVGIGESEAARKNGRVPAKAPPVVPSVERSDCWAGE